jgi:RHS repeat-associated protein
MFGYDAAGRQTSVTDALGGVVHIAYDAAGERTSVTNPRGDMTSFTYDALGDVATWTNPTGGPTTNTYDAGGELVKRLDPRGVTTNFSYDADGHQTLVTFPGGSIANVYDALGRKIQMVDPTGTTSYTYDAASELVSVAAPAGAVSYTYDTAGRRASMTLPGSRTVQYGYDSASRVTQLTDWLGNKINFTYTADGLPSTESRPNGIGTTISYDSADRLVSVHHDSAGGPVAHYDYTLDANGNRTSVVTAAGTESYTLDALSRITEATYPTGEVVRYTYDAAGNRTSQTVNGVATNYTYNSGGELVAVGGTSLSYDAAEEVTRQGTNTYTWDWNGRLASASVAATTSSYTYDGGGVRVAQTVVAATTNYVVDRAGGLPTVVYDGTNAYLQDHGVQTQIPTGGGAQYTLNDALGSVRQLTDSSGNVTASASYGVFGGVRSQSGAPGVFAFGFTGEQTDSTGLVFLRSRYLEPTSGRFLSPDPLFPSAFGTQGYNLFGYALENPTTLTDPTGRQSPSLEYGLRLQGLEPVTGEIQSLVAEGPATEAEVAQCEIVASVQIVTGAPPVPASGCPWLGPLVRLFVMVIAALSLAIVATVATAQPAGEPGTGPQPGGGPSNQPQPTPQPGSAGGGASQPPPKGTTPCSLGPDQTLYRADSRGPDQIFNQGLQAKGTNLDLWQYVTQNPSNAGYVGTSKDLASAQQFATDNSLENIYKLKGRGIDVNECFGAKSPFPSENEVAIPGGVPGSSIEGVWGPNGWFSNPAFVS